MLKKYFKIIIINNLQLSSNPIDDCDNFDHHAIPFDDNCHTKKDDTTNVY